MKPRNKTKGESEYKAYDHTFVICAYKESPYLEECIKSIGDQTQKSNCIIATSTDNEFIRNIAQKYRLRYYVNLSENEGIAADWNYAIEVARTALVTIAHQDDIYLPCYCEKVLEYANKGRSPLILFTDYSEWRASESVANNKLLIIKRIMLLPLRFCFLWNKKFVRRCILAFGSPICCPSVTYVKENLPEPPFFRHGFRSDLDWEVWERFSKLDGSYIYINEKLMSHRIHEASATTEIIADNDRSKEDFEMFCKFWPISIARIFEKFYSQSEKSNKL